MKDKNTYHITMGFVGGIPEIHGDIHRPSDYILDKIYLLSRISDFIEKERDFGIIEGFKLINPTTSPTSGNEKYNNVEYSFSGNSFQLDDGYVLVSNRFLNQIITHGNTGVALEYPVPITHYFGIIYCPKEKNIIDLSSYSNGSYYLYVKYKYDKTNSKLYLQNISRERTKTAVPQNYVFIAGDTYEWIISNSLISNANPDYYNYVLLAEMTKSSGSITLKLKEYNSFIKLSDNVKVQNNSDTESTLSFKIKNLVNKHYEFNFENIYNALNSLPEYSIIRHKFDGVDGLVLLDTHFIGKDINNNTKGILTNSNSITINFVSGVELIIYMNGAPGSFKANMFNNDVFIEYNTIGNNLNLVDNGTNIQFNNNTGSNLEYFIFKIDKNNFAN
ncbi:MAG: hypothetical protein KatS3mg068_1523 [Candidatus Sericytochromatia bacterium]|nr:MAG: hypothetical protein KatS3mg068_1523 [Candidatus Sericytochromatia bacterium]